MERHDPKKMLLLKFFLFFNIYLFSFHKEASIKFPFNERHFRLIIIYRLIFISTAVPNTTILEIPTVREQRINRDQILIVSMLTSVSRVHQLCSPDPNYYNKKDSKHKVANVTPNVIKGTTEKRDESTDIQRRLQPVTGTSFISN